MITDLCLEGIVDRHPALACDKGDNLGPAHRLAKASQDIVIGLLQILFCIAATLIGISLALLANAVDLIIKLWKTALG